MEPETVDFFISYTGVDEPWAEWIAWQLRDAGFSVRIQCWDFDAGTNFVQQMHQAVTEAKRTIAVLSSAFLKSKFTAPEWQAAFSQDPQGTERKLIPVRVAECRPDGLLATVVYIDLVGLNEEESRDTLKREVQGKRPPTSEPQFPGTKLAENAGAAPSFPVTDVANRKQITMTEEPEAAKQASHPRLSASHSVVVYFRLQELKKLNDKQGSFAVVTLARLVDGATQHIDGSEVHSSVYGRFVVLRRPGEAIALAKLVLDEAGQLGVALTVGIDYGRVTGTRDVFAWNVAGDPINTAARLAFLPKNPKWRVACSSTVHGFLSGQDLKFGRETRQNVKRTQLLYRWLHHGCKVSAGRQDSDHEADIAHVVVYDLAGYSESTESEQAISVETLSRFVRESLDAAGGLELLVDSDERWYAPAGDGGVLAFRDRGGPRAAWGFAKYLKNVCREKVSVRIGIATGSVIILDRDYPIGPAVLEADELSALPETGGVSCNGTYWNLPTTVDREGWIASPAQVKKAGWLLLSHENDPRLVAMRVAQPFSHSELLVRVQESLSGIQTDYSRELLKKEIVPNSEKLDWDSVSELIANRLMEEPPAPDASDVVKDGFQKRLMVMMGKLRRIVSRLNEQASNDLAAVHEVEDCFMQAQTESEELDTFFEALKNKQTVILSNVFAGTCDSAAGISRLFRKQPEYKMMKTMRGDHHPAEESVMTAALQPINGASPEEKVFLLLADAASELEIPTDDWDANEDHASQLEDLVKLLKDEVLARSVDMNRVLCAIVRLPSPGGVRDRTVELIESTGESFNTWVDDLLFGMIFVELKIDPQAVGQDKVFVQNIRKRFPN